jgi:hypothetical protein
MSKCPLLILALLLAVVANAQMLQGQAPKRRVDAIRPILQVLDGLGVSGSIEFTGATCKADRLPEFPKFKDIVSDTPSVQQLRDMFAINAAMNVSQDADGTVRMVEADVPSDILNVRIREVRFESPYSYYPNAALERVVLQAPGFKEFLRDHGINWPFNRDWGFSALGNPYPAPEWPHVSGSLYDMKLSQLLDYIVRGFPGIWMYENCPQDRTRGRTVWIQTVHYKHHGSNMLVLQ